MEPTEGFDLGHLWAELVTDITRKVTKSYEASDHDLIRAASAVSNLPPATLADSAFLTALGTPEVRNALPQTETLAQRAIEEWHNGPCGQFFRPCVPAAAAPAQLLLLVQSQVRSLSVKIWQR